MYCSQRMLMKYYNDNFIFLNFIHFIYASVTSLLVAAGGICINNIGQPDRNLQKHNTEIIKAGIRYSELVSIIDFLIITLVLRPCNSQPIRPSVHLDFQISNKFPQISSFITKFLHFGNKVPHF